MTHKCNFSQQLAIQFSLETSSKLFLLIVGTLEAALRRGSEVMVENFAFHGNPPGLPLGVEGNTQSEQDQGHFRQ